MSFVVKPSTLAKGLKALFMEAFGNGELPADIAPFIVETDSDSSSEDYGWLGQAPSLSEWVDERKIKALNNFKYSIPNKSYEGTIGVNRDAIKDDRMGAVKVRINDLAAKARVHSKKLFIELLKNGTTDLCYDGLPFFSASHVEGKSGTQTNLYPGTGTSLAQIQADVEGAVAQMKALKDDVGEPFDESEVVLGVVIPLGLEAAFNKLNTLEMINNTTNSMKGKIRSIVTSARLTDVNDYYIMNIGPGVKPIVKQNRQPPEFQSLEGDSDAGFMRKTWHYGIDYRVGWGYGLWQKAVKVTNT